MDQPSTVNRRPLRFLYAAQPNPDGIFIPACLASSHRYDAGSHMSDIIFIGAIIALYVVSHALVIGLAKLGGLR